MRPVLFELAGWGVPTHEFFISVGVVAATVVYFAEARRRNWLNEQIAWVALGALFSGAIFAKLSTVWRFAGDGAGWGELWLHGGRSILGGLAGAYLGAEVTKRIVGYRQSTGDLFAPAVAIGMAIGRVGCFLTEQIGTPTELPWGIAVDAGTAASIPMCPNCAVGAPMHPSFGYEILFHAVMFLVLVRHRDSFARRGRSFKVYLLAYGLFRFGVEFVRGNPEMEFGLSGSQLFLLVTVPLLVWHMTRSRLPELKGVPS